MVLGSRGFGALQFVLGVYKQGRRQQVRLWASDSENDERAERSEIIRSEVSAKVCAANERMEGWKAAVPVAAGLWGRWFSQAAQTGRRGGLPLLRKPANLEGQKVRNVFGSGPSRSLSTP